MKKVVLFVLLAAGLRMSGLLPFESSDVSSLVPVQALCVSVNRGTVVVDAGECRGQGEDWQSALEDLRHGAAGEVFLGTAEHLVLTEGAVNVLRDVIEGGQLRPAAAVCVAQDFVPEPKDAAEYLAAHDGGVTIQDVQAAVVRREVISLPVLTQTEGGLRLHGTTDR